MGGQPGVQSEFQDPPGYTDKPGLEKEKNRGGVDCMSHCSFQYHYLNKFAIEMGEMEEWSNQSIDACVVERGGIRGL